MRLISQGHSVRCQEELSRVWVFDSCGAGPVAGPGSCGGAALHPKGAEGCRLPATMLEVISPPCPLRDGDRRWYTFNLKLV